MPARTLAYTGGKAMSPAITQGRARLSSSTKIKMMRDTTGTAFTADTSGASSSSTAANRAAAAARTTASKHPASQPPQMHLSLIHISCNGLACRNTIPGPGAKGIGTGFIRNYQKWQELCVNMDTICENKPVDTTFTLFGRAVSLPVFAAPVGAMTLHYGDKYDDLRYNDTVSYRHLGPAGRLRSDISHPRRTGQPLRSSGAGRRAAGHGPGQHHDGQQ